MKRAYQKKKFFLHDNAHYGLTNLKLSVNSNRSHDTASDIVGYSTFKPENESYNVSVTSNPSDAPIITNPTYNYPINHSEETRDVQPIEITESLDLNESAEMDANRSNSSYGRATVLSTSDARAHQSSTNATTKEDNNAAANATQDTTGDAGKNEKITCSSLTIISNCDNHSSDDST